MSAPLGFTGHARALTWRCVSFGCRYRDVQDDVAIAEAVCLHPKHDGKPCTGVEAALQRCPVIEAATAAAISTSAQQGLAYLVEAGKRGFAALASKLGFRPHPGKRLPNYYAILGVPKTATTEEIQERYRELAKRYHPDRAGGDAEKMSQLNQARDVLTDPDARAEYDRRYYKP